MSGFTVIILILFWALFAFAVVSFMAYVYIQCMYYKWRKDDRLKESLASQIENAANAIADSIADTVENLEIPENNS